jgi:hypothetical protein
MEADGVFVFFEPGSDVYGVAIVCPALLLVQDVVQAGVVVYRVSVRERHKGYSVTFPGVQLDDVLHLARKTGQSRCPPLSPDSRFRSASD